MSSVHNGTYGFGTVLTADREALAEQPSNVEQPSKKARVLPPATSANEVMQFHFVDSWKQIPAKQEDLDRDIGSLPLFTNQVFEEEEIQGYEGLEIDIVLDTAEFIPRMFLKYTFKEKGPTLEDALKDADVVHQFSHDTSESKGIDCRILHSVPATAEGALRTLHARLHPLLLFYIDGSSGLQQDDANMHLLLLVKYVEDKPVGVLGMLTYFELYAFPTQKRLRVAQILIMPPSQKQGLGREMLTAVNKMAAAGEGKVADIAYEDAAEPLQALRERMDAEAAAAIPEVWESAQQCVRNACQAVASGRADGAAAGGSGAAGPSSAADEDGANESALGAGEHDALEALQVSKETACMLREKLKLVPQQVQVVWDVLLWAAADRCKICSQDDITDLLQARVMQRELIDVAEQMAKAPAEGHEVPENKVVLEGDVLEALEEQAAERDNLSWQEKHKGQGQGSSIEGEATGHTDSKDAPMEAAAPASGEAASEEQESDGGEGEDDVAPNIGKLDYVMFRADRRSKAVRRQKGSQGVPTVEWSALNDDAKASIVEIVNDRREAIERIAYGMRWP